VSPLIYSAHDMRVEARLCKVEDLYHLETRRSLAAAASSLAQLAKRHACRESVRDDDDTDRIVEEAVSAIVIRSLRCSVSVRRLTGGHVSSMETPVLVATSFLSQATAAVRSRNISVTHPESCT